MKPYADNRSTMSVDGLTAENGSSVVATSGISDVTRDREGLKRARALKQLADALVHTLEGVGDLPEEATPADKPGNTLANPFT